jgi:pimeloyl-ACP methyl ester carboxylesterase
LLKRLLLALVVAAAAAAAAVGYLRWSDRRAEDRASSYLTDADRLMTISGTNVRVRVEGPADAPAIILLHGFIYSLETWDAWTAALRSDYRVVRFDLLGHGLSGPDPMRRYSPQERADFIGDIMDALAIEEAIIGGNSLGGLAAWRFAATAPERVKALILVSPGGYPTNGVAEEPLPPPPPVAAFLKTAPDAGVALTLQNIYGDDSKITADRVQLIAHMMRREGNGEAFIQSIEEFTLPDPEPLLRRIAAPTLILWGAADIVIPVEQGRRMAAAIPNARLIIYDGVGHVAQEEAAAETAAAVKAFLAETGLDE